MRSTFIFVAAIAIAASLGNAQAIYEPVQYQYGGQNPYYYGGSDPLVHESARHPYAPGASWGRGNGYAFRSGSIHTHREVVTERPRVFTDELPYRNAYIYGFTVNDARNEAYARQPNYFRMVDVRRAALPDASGRGWVVPAAWPDHRPGHIIIRPMPRRTLAPATTRTARPILIIPKDRLERAPEDDGDSTLRDPLLTRAD
jgi:hypothetical protein